MPAADTATTCAACLLPLAPPGMTPPPGYRRHPGCDDPARPELYCAGCKMGPAGCQCRTPARWRPSPAALDATADRLAEVLGGTVLPAPPPAKPRPARVPGPKCACGHAAHAKACRARSKGGRCTPMDLGGGGTAIACGYRPACPCAYRTCKCGAGVELAAELPRTARTLPADGDVMVVSVERDPAPGRPATLAVRQLADGYLAVRDLPPSGDLDRCERPAAEHTNAACPLLAKSEADPRWLVLRG